jgi:hypothetical protein
VALDGADDLEPLYALPFSAREWQTSELATGDAVTLTVTTGAARLVASDGEYVQAETEAPEATGEVRR